MNCNHGYTHIIHIISDHVYTTFCACTCLCVIYGSFLLLVSRILSWVENYGNGKTLLVNKILLINLQSKAADSLTSVSCYSNYALSTPAGGTHSLALYPPGLSHALLSSSPTRHLPLMIVRIRPELLNNGFFDLNH